MTTVGLVFQDIVRVWRQPRALAQEVTVQGRGGFAFGVMALLFLVCFLIEAGLRAWSVQQGFLPVVEDLDFGDLRVSYHWAEAFFIVLTILVGFFQWLVLPRVAWWFRVKRERISATNSIYLMLAISLFNVFFYFIIELVGTSIRPISAVLSETMVYGGNFAVFISVVHITTLMIRIILDVSSYWRTFAILAVSFVIALVFGVGVILLTAFVVLKFCCICEARSA